MANVSKHDLVSSVLIWCPALASAAAAALGARGVLIWSAGGLAACAATWAYFAFVGRTRAAWMSRLDQTVRALWSALGESPPTRDDADPRDRAAWLIESVEQATNPLTLRTRQAAADQANLRAVYDASISPSLATDAQGRIVLANVAAERFFAKGGLAGRHIEDLFTQLDVLGQHARAISGKTTVGQVRMSRPEGVKVFQVLSAPLALQVLTSAPRESVSQPGALLAMRDVTELALAVQLKTDFVANASHELRTPLSSIRAAVETLADGAWDDGAMRERLAQMITGNVSRLEEMVRDLLDLSRLESPDAPVTMETVVLSDVCEGLKDVFAGVCSQRSLTIVLELDRRCDRLETDRKLLTLVLRNLIDNATKFAFEGTSIRVISERTTSDSSRRPGIRLQVTDQGVGIPVGHQQRIFERFYQVDPSRAGPGALPAGTPVRRGTGLGLAIVKHAVKTLGGAISVESVWKQGTTITVDLPSCVLDAVSVASRE